MTGGPPAGRFIRDAAQDRQTAGTAKPEPAGFSEEAEYAEIGNHTSSAFSVRAYIT